MQNSLIRSTTITISITVLIGGCLAGCGGGSSPKVETPDTSSYRPEPTPATDFERQMKFIRGGRFKYVWVFSRPDGQIFTKEDGEIFRKYTPKVVDRVAVDGGKQYITGSNFDLDAAQKAALKKRFKFEDYSGK